MLKESEDEKKLLTYEHEAAQTNAALSPPLPPVITKTRLKWFSPRFILLLLLLILGGVLINDYFNWKLHARHLPFYLQHHHVAIDSQQFFRVTQFTVQGDSSVTKLHLQFNYPLSYQIHTTENTLEVAISNVKIEPSLTTFANTLITNIQLDVNASGLVLKFTLANNVHIDTYSANGMSSNLNLTLHYVAPIIEKEYVDPQQYLAELSYQKAMIALNNKQEEEAITELKQALKANNNYLLAQLMLIKLLIKQNKLETAQRYLWAALADQSDNPDLLVLQATLWSQQGKYAQAEKLLSTYKPPLESNLNYYATQAYLENKIGNAQLAIRFYEQVLAIDPYNGNWWLGFALALQNNKLPHAAVAAYQRALQTTNLDPTVRAYITTKLKNPE